MDAIAERCVDLTEEGVLRILLAAVALLLLSEDLDSGIGSVGGDGGGGDDGNEVWGKFLSGIGGGRGVTCAGDARVDVSGEQVGRDASYGGLEIEGDAHDGLVPSGERRAGAVEGWDRERSC